MAVICVDFDDTIHSPKVRVPGYRMGTPIDGAKDALERLTKQGHIIIVLTARDEHEHVRDWLDYFSIPHAYVTNVKPTADIYIDNRALRFEGDWVETLAEVFCLL